MKRGLGGIVPKTCQPKVVCKVKHQPCTNDGECVSTSSLEQRPVPANFLFAVLRPELGMQGRAIHEEKDSYRSHPDEDLSAKSGLQGEGSDMHKRWRLCQYPVLEASYMIS